MTTNTNGLRDESSGPVGLHQKYLVERVADSTGKHADCRYFVLDPQHDLLARDAMRHYAERTADLALAHDLLGWLDDLDAT